jgi:hypothetical protein
MGSVTVDITLTKQLYYRSTKKYVTNIKFVNKKKKPTRIKYVHNLAKQNFIYRDE